MIARLFAGAALAVAMASTASAAEPFMAQEGHWSVVGLGVSCLAANRPAAEFNAAPWNALALNQRRDGAPVLQVFAWPNLFRAGQMLTLTLAVDNADAVTLQATALDSYLVQAREPLSQDLRAAMRSGQLLEVTIAGSPTRQFFDITHVEAVLATLQRCAQTRDRK